MLATCTEREAGNRQPAGAEGFRINTTRGEDWFLSKHKTWEAGPLLSEVPGLPKTQSKKSLLKLQSSFFAGRSGAPKVVAILIS